MSPWTSERHAALPAFTLLFLLLLGFASAAHSASNAQWWDGFAAPPAGKGMQYRVSAFATYGDDLIVGGGFTQAGNNGACVHIARFDGTRWFALGGGMNDWVSTLLSIDGDLYAGGDFTVAGQATPIAANHVARWDGSTWSALGDGTDGTILAMTVFQGDLVVAGDFTEAGGVPANRVARWNGTSWSALGTGLGSDVGSHRVRALAEFQGDLYAGGSFSSLDGTLVTGFARWDGTSWTDAGATLTHGGSAYTDRVQVLSTELDGNLLVGGCLSHVNGTFVNGLASFDGTTWTPLGVGLNEPAAVWDVAVHHGDLIASGSEVATPGGAGAARRSTGMWSALESGLSPFDLFGVDIVAQAHGSDLYFGGNISFAGSLPSAYIARWTDAAVDAPEVAAAAGLRLEFAGANPFRSGTSFAFSLPHAGTARVSVHDAAGRLVDVLADGTHDAGGHRAEWDGRNGVGEPIGSGVYFVRLTAAGGSVTRKVVFTR